MKRIIQPLIILLEAAGLLLMPMVVSADNEQMNQVLQQMVRQLDATLVLIDKASALQDAHARTQFHFERYTDSEGHSHPGLRDDLIAVRSGIMAQLNEQVLSPRQLAPIAGDYRQSPTLPPQVNR